MTGKCTRPKKRHKELFEEVTRICKSCHFDFGEMSKKACLIEFFKILLSLFFRSGIRLSVCLSLSVFLSVYLSVCLSICLSVCLSGCFSLFSLVLSFPFSSDLYFNVFTRVLWLEEEGGGGGGGLYGGKSISKCFPSKTQICFSCLQSDECVLLVVLLIVA